MEGSSLRRALVAEDDAVNSRLLQIILEAGSWVVHAVADGRAFLDLALTQRFDLAIVDAWLPELDGLEAIRQLRAREQSRLPVLVVTGAVMPGDEQSCLESGADAYLAKPFRREDLLRAVDRLTGGE